MKNIIICTFLNLFLVSFALFIIVKFYSENPPVYLMLYIFSSLFLPIIGISVNTFLKSKMNVILSNTYLALLTTATIIIPIEYFKRLDSTVKVHDKLDGKTFGNKQSSITMEMDLGFNISQYLIVLLIWIFIGSLLSIFVNRRKKNHHA